MKIATKRLAGEILGRGGISQRIVLLADDIAKGTFKNAIEKAGQIAALVESATYDEYWTEKANIGKYREQAIFDSLINKDLSRDAVITRANPYK